MSEPALAHGARNKAEDFIYSADHLLPESEVANG